MLGLIERMGMGLAPRCKQAPPCLPQNPGQQWLEGWLSTFLLIHKWSTLTALLVQGLRGVGLEEKIQLHPASCSSPVVPHLFSFTLVRALSFIFAV